MLIGGCWLFLDSIFFVWFCFGILIVLGEFCIKLVFGWGLVLDCLILFGWFVVFLRVLILFVCCVMVGWSNEWVFGFKVVLFKLLFKIVLFIFGIVVDFFLRKELVCVWDWRFLFIFLIIVFFKFDWVEDMILVLV